MFACSHESKEHFEGAMCEDCHGVFSMKKKSADLMDDIEKGQQEVNA